MAYEVGITWPEPIQIPPSPNPQSCVFPLTKTRRKRLSPYRPLESGAKNRTFCMTILSLRFARINKLDRAKYHMTLLLFHPKGKAPRRELTHGKMAGIVPGGYVPIYAIFVCAAPKGRVLPRFCLWNGSRLCPFWSIWNQVWVSRDLREHIYRSNSNRLRKKESMRIKWILRNLLYWRSNLSNDDIIYYLEARSENGYTLLARLS